MNPRGETESDLGKFSGRNSDYSDAQIRDLYECYVRFVEEACEEILDNSLSDVSDSLDDLFLAVNTPISRFEFEDRMKMVSSDHKKMAEITEMLKNGFSVELQKRVDLFKRLTSDYHAKMDNRRVR